MKRCSKCGKWLDKSCFSKCKTRSKDGLTWWCKSCDKAHYQANKEKCNARSKVYNQKHKEKLKAYVKEWAQQNAKQVKARTQAYYRKHKEKNYYRHVWYNMIYRCTNPKHVAYRHYGGRGIKVLYKDFDEFIKDVGKRPTPEHTIDRINNDGHYEPGNCKWSTRDEQQRNKRPFKRPFKRRNRKH